MYLVFFFVKLTKEKLKYTFHLWLQLQMETKPSISYNVKLSLCCQHF